MTLPAPAHMVVVKKEDKEEKLRSFLAAALSEIGAQDAKPVLRLLARCKASPAVRAVASLSAQLAGSGVEMRLMLALLDQSGASPAPCEVRHLADLRCLDAHEMLVIGAETSWVGDSMRRDPSVRDSFELHSPSSAAAARHYAVTFDRLWERAVAVQMPQADAMALVADLAALPVEPAVGHQVLTRH